MTQLRRRMIDDMGVRWMAKATQEADLAAVVGLARFDRRSPDQISDAEVQAYLRHLMRDRKRAWNTCNMVVHGWRFLYHVTLKRDRTSFSIPGGRQPATLPEIVSREEVPRVIATGVRVSELVHLRLTDLDADRGLVRIEQGKGAKDRYPILSPRLQDALRAYRTTTDPRGWLFPARKGRHALHTIQRLLGHRSIQTTTRDLHVAQSSLTVHGAPIELLSFPSPLSPSSPD